MKIRSVVTLVILTLLLGSPADAATERTLTRLEVLDLAMTGKFAELDGSFVALQSRFERESTREAEDAVVNSFLSFASTRAGLARRLKQWREEMPLSYAARVASGTHRAHLAGAARYDRRWIDRPEERQAAVRGHASKARAQFNAALSIDAKVSRAWSGLIGLATLTSDTRERDEVLARALVALPRSLEVRGAYLLALQPNRGGSQEAMRSFLDSSRTALGTEDFALLAAHALIVEADERLSAGEYERARDLYDRALSAGEHWRFLFGRAASQRRLGKHEAALADVNRALTLRPQSPTLLHERALIEKRLAKREAALADLDTALAIDPRDADLRLTRTWLLLANFRRTDAALRDGRRLVKLAPRRSDSWEAYASVLLWGKKDAQGARAAFRRALTLGPTNADAWFGYGQALYSQGDGRALDAFDRYTSLCSGGQSCEPDDLQWMHEFVRRPLTYVMWPSILLRWQLLAELL